VVVEKVKAMSEVAKVILRISSHTLVDITITSFEPSQDSKSSMWTLDFVQCGSDANFPQSGARL
jgi:hypothetical protein